jgi:hypothetical protein
LPRSVRWSLRLHGLNESWLTVADDIVTQLRNQVCECGYSASFDELHKCLRCEAADEIESLRAERDLLRKIADSFSICPNGCEDCKNDYEELTNRG